MVEATVEGRTDARRLARVSTRTLLAATSALSDVGAMLGALLFAVAVQSSVLATSSVSAAASVGVWIAVFVVVTGVSFYAAGLYELEVYVSRSVHLWALVKASVVAGAVSVVACLVFDTGVRANADLCLMTFALFVLFSALLRVVVLDGRYVAWTR